MPDAYSSRGTEGFVEQVTNPLDTNASDHPTQTFLYTSSNIRVCVDIWTAEWSRLTQWHVKFLAHTRVGNADGLPHNRKDLHKFGETFPPQAVFQTKHTLMCG